MFRSDEEEMEKEKERRELGEGEGRIFEGQRMEKRKKWSMEK